MIVSVHYVRLDRLFYCCCVCCTVYQSTSAGLRPRLPSRIPPKLRELVESTWKADPLQRPSMKEVASSLQRIYSDLQRLQPKLAEMKIGSEDLGPLKGAERPEIKKDVSVMSNLVAVEEDQREAVFDVEDSSPHISLPLSKEAVETIRHGRTASSPSMPLATSWNTKTNKTIFQTQEETANAAANAASGARRPGPRRRPLSMNSKIRSSVDSSLGNGCV